MFLQKIVPVLSIFAASLPFAMADTCSVEARVSSTFAGSSEALTVILGDGTRLTFDNDNPVCDKNVLSTGEDGNLKGDGSLAHPVAITTECDEGTIKSCKADYDTQKAIKGGLGDKSGQNYHMCTVTFDC